MTAVADITKSNETNQAKTLGLIAALILVIFLAGCPHQQPVPGTDGGAREKAAIDISALEKRALQSPNDVKAWIALGNGLMDTNRWQSAINAYEKALELDPKNVDVRVDLGTCYRNFGRIDKAMEEYRTAIGIDPNHKNARRRQSPREGGFKKCRTLTTGRLLLLWQQLLCS